MIGVDVTVVAEWVVAVVVIVGMVVDVIVVWLVLIVEIAVVLRTEYDEKVLMQLMETYAFKKTDLKLGNKCKRLSPLLNLNVYKFVNMYTRYKI